MNVKIECIGGGIFSRLMLVLQSIENQIINVENIDNIYIGVDDSRNHIEFTSNPFDFVFEQDPDMVIHKNLYCHFMPAINPTTEFIKSNKCARLRTIASKLRLKESVLWQVPPMRPSTLGIHIRLTDMDSIHGDIYGISDFKCYTDKIEEVLNNSYFKNITVASDNEESILKLRKIYPNIMVNPNVRNRNDSEYGGDYLQYQMDQMNSEIFWVSTFIEMLTIASCQSLIYRVSNFNNAAVVFSDTIKESYLVNTI